jgi:ABC-type amino acid transport system permease subunit
VILLVAGAYFLIPLWAALRFAGIKALGSVVTQAGFGDALWLSVRLAIVTTLITIALMLPTAVYVHLRLPKVRRLLEGITILPIVIPPVVLSVGVLEVAPGYLKSTPYLLALMYVILAMPFAYRAIDAGLRALDLKTVVEASNSLGAGWITTLWRVVLPNLKTRAAVRYRADRGPGARRVHHGQPVPVPDVPGMDRGLRPDQRPDLSRGLAGRPVRDVALPDGHHGVRHPAVAPHRRRPGHAVQRRPSRNAGYL